MNGFDLNATEAALKIRDDGVDVNITVIMVGNDFVNDVHRFKGFEQAVIYGCFFVLLCFVLVLCVKNEVGEGVHMH